MKSEENISMMELYPFVAVYPFTSMHMGHKSRISLNIFSLIRFSTFVLHQNSFNFLSTTNLLTLTFYTAELDDCFCNASLNYKLFYGNRQVIQGTG